MPQKVSLAAIKAAETSSGGRRRGCGFAEFVKTLDPKERRELAEAMADPMVSSKAIWRVLRARGLTQTHYVIVKHRNDDSYCSHCGVAAAGKKTGQK